MILIFFKLPIWENVLQLEVYILYCELNYWDLNLIFCISIELEVKVIISS